MADLQVNQKYSHSPDVHKFGGTSLQDSSHILKVIEKIQSKVKKGDFVVVSANGQVTDYLLAFIHGKKQAWHDLNTYLKQLIGSVLKQPDLLMAKVERELNQLIDDVQQASSHQDEILALGELWSAQLLSAKLNELDLSNNWLDAREFLVLDEQNDLVNKTAVRSLLLETAEQCSHELGGLLINVVTGYIARDLQGNSITLGRNGSDYTATLIAELVQSETVYLWTDVDGVYSADPKVVQSARCIDHLTIGEAQALSELGSNVLHQKTITPILQQATKLVINSCSSTSVGTVVDHLAVSQPKTATSHSAGKIKTLAHKQHLVYLSISHIKELKARQLQTQLTAAQVNNYANHFDKTENTLSFYVESRDLFKTTKLMAEEDLALNTQLTNVSMVSAVGCNIRQNHFVISKLLNRSAKFKIHQIHYPANDHTLSIFLSDGPAVQLLDDLHQTFFGLEPSTPIVILGYGNIGQQLVKILKANKTKTEKAIKQSLLVVAVANSQSFQFNQRGLLDQTIELNQSNKNGAVLQAIQSYAGQPLIIIDLTASEWVAKQYLGFAQNGWHLISANKVAAANPSYAQSIEHVLKKNQRQWLKNTTAGAALPIQKSIKRLKQSGDQIRSVTGVFSGSLSWLFGQYDGQTDFMHWVKQAQENGFTEPDPRADLSGQDVYRKAIILAQELGFEPTKINFKPVLSKELLSGSIDDFWQNEVTINSYIKTMWHKASLQGQQLRYLASVSADELKVELVAVELGHPAAGLKPGDNIFIIESDWYRDNPLVIQGPGAGREVTAAGVLNDLIEVLRL
ncbi:bifunctional aspartate kinase/homoserine dehydrogenase II [Marinicella litoralis]|uniref:Aspartate kinase n=1 Tax=Marinicella litoralis TaxID=644220 RepID=A0A4R6XJ63_9GAMM|nr:bifunctional aspartate kinase/homoserine dehydrogenase II [Marinicella litoralis]TDR19546.1 aspartate kinase [Marinicella litoralis]